MIRPSRDLVRVSAHRRPRSGRSRWLARLLAACAALAVLAPPSTARAADSPDSLTIVGPGISLPISITASAQSDLFTALLRQVTWMPGRAGDFAKPDPKSLGPTYTITIFVKGVASQVYDVYPSATGGPRAHRPKAQPKGQATEAWFYATVTLPTVLRSAGVPVPMPSASGPAGAMAYEDPQYQPDAVTAPLSVSLNKELDRVRLAVAITAAIAVVVLLMLLAAARVSRRRWSR